MSLSYPMKIPKTLLLPLRLSVVASAQTNTFPASGNIGIGTTNPEAKREVAGTAIIGPTAAIIHRAVGDGDLDTNDAAYISRQDNSTGPYVERG